LTGDPVVDLRRDSVCLVPKSNCVPARRRSHCPTKKSPSCTPQDEWVACHPSFGLPKGRWRLPGSLAGVRFMPYCGRIERRIEQRHLTFPLVPKAVIEPCIAVKDARAKARMSGSGSRLLNRSFAPTFFLSNSGSFAHRDGGANGHGSNYLVEAQDHPLWFGCALSPPPSKPPA
jgi:hypothetical protein